METLKKIDYGLKKTVLQGTLLETDLYKYLEIDTNTEENIKDQKKRWSRNETKYYQR